MASRAPLRRNKPSSRRYMASRFASVSEEKNISINEEAVPKNTKMATKSGFTVFNGKLFNHYNLLLVLRQKIKIQRLEFTRAIEHYNYNVKNGTSTTVLRHYFNINTLVIHLSVGKSNSYLRRRLATW